jgi:hypothetical protein
MVAGRVEWMQFVDEGVDRARLGMQEFSTPLVVLGKLCTPCGALVVIVHPASLSDTLGDR